MLGRTDSRRRLLVLLLVFVVGSLALVARTAYWQVVRGGRADGVGRRPDLGHGSRSAGRRGEIYDRTRRVLLATTVDARPARRGRRPADARPAGDGRPTRWSGCWGSTRPPRADIRAKLASDKPYVILARGITPEMAERIRQAGNATAGRRPLPRARAGAGLPAGGRRPRTRPSPRTCSASSTARASGSTASSSTTRKSWPARRACCVAQRDVERPRPVRDRGRPGARGPSARTCA